MQGEPSDPLGVFGDLSECGYSTKLEQRNNMARKRKSWREKLEEERPVHGKIMRILVPKPLDVVALMNRIPKGKAVTDEQIRERLARDNDADRTCSWVTGIFVRIAAEVAEEDAREGKSEITPYWRVIARDGSLKSNLPGGVERQKELLEQEGHSVAQQGKKLVVVDFEQHLAKL